MKDVEKIAEREILRPDALDQQRRVMPRQRAVRADEAQKRGRQVGRSRLGAAGARRLKIADLAPGKRKRGPRAEAHGLLVGRRILAHRTPWKLARRIESLAPQAFKQAHGLEELETMRLAAQAIAYRSTVSPARGGHRRISPSRCFVVAISLENELTEQYRPRNRSRTQANRKGPLPTKLFSSS